MRPDPPARATVWVVAGAPGAGKSTVAAHLLARLRPVPALLDKDAMYGGFVAATLAAAGRSDGEREGPWYDEHVKLHEYAGMTSTARSIRATAAPSCWTPPSPARSATRTRGRPGWTELGGEPVRLVWVGCDAETLRGRLERRGRPQDAGKLANFDSWLARMTPDVPPPVPHLAVDTGAARTAGTRAAGCPAA